MLAFRFLSFLFILFFSFTLRADLPVTIDSEVAFLMNIDTDQVLYSKNADRIIAPASMTKIATALFTLKELGEGDLDVMIEADQDCVGSITPEMQKSLNYKHPAHWQVIGGTHMQIAKGDKISLEELLYGMLLVSANDASNVIAKYVSGNISTFVREMNQFMIELGCENTHFRNPHGLNYPKHHSTAKEIALITQEALKYRLFKKIVATPKMVAPIKGTLTNSNLLVVPSSRYYDPRAIGVKTGTDVESKAGYSLASAFTHEGRNLLLVLSQVPSIEARYQDTLKLINAAFSEKLEKQTFLKKGPQPFSYRLQGFKKVVKTELKESIELEFYPAEKPQLKASIHWHPPALPIKKGDVVADITLIDAKEKVWAKAELFALKSVRIFSFKNFLFKSFLMLIALILFFVFKHQFFRTKEIE